MIKDNQWHTEYFVYDLPCKAVDQIIPLLILVLPKKCQDNSIKLNMKLIYPINYIRPNTNYAKMTMKNGAMVKHRRIANIECS